MEESPVYGALSVKSGHHENTVEGLTDDQIKQLLIFMGTITVISFVLVITLVTIFIAFIWYSRNQLKCACSSGRQHQLKATFGHGTILSMPTHEKHINQEHQLSTPRTIPRHSTVPGHPTFGPLTESVKMFAVSPGQFQNFHGHKNSVIVNPLLSVEQRNWRGRQVDTQQTVLAAPIPEQDLVPSINQSREPMVSTIYSVEDELDLIVSSSLKEEDTTSVSEPIYAEIKQKVTEVGGAETDLDEDQSKVNKFVEEENTSDSRSKKKEIEYWQITAKEVVKFRPCTETFIKRE